MEREFAAGTTSTCTSAGEVRDQRRPRVRGDEPQAGCCEILQDRCRELGVDVHFSTPAPGRRASSPRRTTWSSRATALNSAVRARYADTFRPDAGERRCRYMWLGTDKVFDAFKFDVRETPYGVMQIHGYPYDATWQHVHRRDARRRVAGAPGSTRCANADRPPGESDEKSIDLIREMFADVLDGHEVLANNSRWIELHDGPQRDLAARQRRAARRRRAHRALLHRVRHQAGDGGRARRSPRACTSTDDLDDGARRPTRTSAGRSCCRPSAQRRRAWSGSRTSASTSTRSRCSSRSTS